MDGYGLITQDDIHEWLFHISTPTIGATKYCMLSRASFDPDGTSMDEVPTGVGYARASMADATFFNVITHPTTFVTENANQAEIQFGPSSAAWGTIEAFGVMVNNTIVPSPGTDPDIYFGGDLDVAKDIQIDTVAVFAVGNLKLQTLNSV